MVTSVQDEATKLVGVAGGASGSSPHNLLADTLGDELKLATQGKSRVFGVSLKDRASVLPAGFAGNGAYWIDPKSGAWVTSTYYRSELPKWAQDFNDGKHAEKYLNLDWKDASGNVLRTTKPPAGKQDFYGVVGATPYANDYEFDFARDLITYEKLGAAGTDLLVVSFSANDILGHKVGPDYSGDAGHGAGLDRQLARLLHFPRPSSLDLPMAGHSFRRPWSRSRSRPWPPSFTCRPWRFLAEKLTAQMNRDLLNAKFSAGKPIEFIKDFDYTIWWLTDDAFSTAQVKEEDAERAVGEAHEAGWSAWLLTRGPSWRGAGSRHRTGLKYADSYSPHGGWYLMTVPSPYSVLNSERGTDHGQPYTYDAHVPLLFYGFRFSRELSNSAEPVDMAATLASLLGINAPTHAVGRVLTESLSPATRQRTPPARRPSSPPLSQIQPVTFPCWRQRMPQSGNNAPNRPTWASASPEFSSKNPVIAASGTFGYGVEFEDVVHLDRLGGFVVKGLSKEPMTGNPPPRLYETPAGMLNAIGLQNIGARAFVDEKLPKLREMKNIVVFANVFGYTRAGLRTDDPDFE